MVGGVVDGLLAAVVGVGEYQRRTGTFAITVVRQRPQAFTCFAVQHHQAHIFVRVERAEVHAAVFVDGWALRRIQVLLRAPGDLLLGGGCDPQFIVVVQSTVHGVEGQGGTLR